MSPTSPMKTAAIAVIGLVAIGSGVAHAQVLGNLPFGVHFDLETCMEGDNVACKRAALEMSHAGWEAFLRQEDAPESLSGDALAVYRHLNCAAWETGDCRALGDEALENGDRFRAAMLHLWSCSLAESESCTRFEIAPDGYSSADGLKTNLDDRDRDTYGLVDDTPPDVKTLKKIAGRCDGKKGSLNDCVTLARAYNDQPTVAGRQQVEAGLDEVCTKHGSPSACSLLQDIREIDRHWDPRMQHSLDLMAELCSQGSVEKACFATARALESGKGLSYGSWASRNFYGYACDGGDGDSCEQLTHAYTMGWADLALDTCQRVRNGEDLDPRSCTEAHTVRTFGVGADKDETLAAQLKGIACDEGAFRPCVWLGNEAWEGDKQAAFELYRKACAGGDGISCGVIGRMMIKGEADVAQDVSAGNEKLRLGCERNAGNACFELGYSYSQERGFSRDSARAAELYAKACSLGYANGCSSLGVLYMDGRGVPANGAYSKWLLNDACARGFGSACRNLGNGYIDGLQGYAQDEARARWSCQQGCDTEHEDSCTRLAEMGEGEMTPAEAGSRPPRNASPSYTAYSAPVYTPSTPSGPSGPGRPDPPSWSSKPLARGYFSFGTERSWSAPAQASTLRGGFLVELGPLGVGMDFDWNTDNRWRPKIARSYQRIGMWGNVALVLPIGRKAALDIGGGGGLGLYREGPGQVNEPLFSGGAKEFIQFNAFIEDFLVGVRIEQQQLFQEHAAMPLDHVTAVYAVIGGRSDD